MYTQCPECLTIYEIDEDALQASLGIVCCGRCAKRFDALRTLSDTLPLEPLSALPELVPTEQAPTLTIAVPESAFEEAARKRQTRENSGTGSPAGSTQQPTDSEPSPPTSEVAQKPSDYSADDWFADFESELAEPATGEVRDTSASSPNDDSAWSVDLPEQADAAAEHARAPDTDAGNADASDWDVSALSEPARVDQGPDPATSIPDIEAPTLVEAVAEYDVDEPGADSPTESPDAEDKPETATASAPVYVRPRSRRVSRAGVAWIIGCVVLALVLAAQVGWIRRVALFRNPATQPWVARICQALPCRLPPIKDIAKLELLSRDVRPDPNAAGALMITATVRNDATFRQPWPVVVVELTDLDNRTVAMRRFRPAEYMPDPATRADGIEPGVTAALAFEVADPGKRAVAFQFSFE